MRSVRHRLELRDASGKPFYFDSLDIQPRSLTLPVSKHGGEVGGAGLALDGDDADCAHRNAHSRLRFHELVEEVGFVDVGHLSIPFWMNVLITSHTLTPRRSASARSHASILGGKVKRKRDCFMAVPYIRRIERK